MNDHTILLHYTMQTDEFSRYVQAVNKFEKICGYNLVVRSVGVDDQYACLQFESDEDKLLFLLMV